MVASSTSAITGIPPDALKVLLIEDNLGDARLIREMLAGARAAFQLQIVDRLGRGLERLAAGDIGVVLLDLSLPDSQGIETFNMVRLHAPKVPILVMSGLDDETVAVRAVQAGAQDYLVKGHVDTHLLLRAIRYAIERSRTAQQLSHYADELRRQNTQLQSDLNLAHEIQQVFLPHEYPSFPRAATPAESALHFCHCYQSTAALGGDFFNVVPVSETDAGIFICDVMGHGIRAALVTAIIRGLMEEMMPLAADAGRYLTAMNHGLRAIFMHTEQPVMATAFYLVTDLRHGELHFASAGHPSPLRACRKTGLVDPLRQYDPRHGAALGLFDESTYPTCVCPVTANDLVILYTDGLYEVIRANNQEYGQERLLNAVRQRIALPPERMFDELLDEIREFSGNAEFEDDICLVGMEVTKRLSELSCAAA